jgi:hypothetical protein
MSIITTVYVSNITTIYNFFRCQKAAKTHTHYFLNIYMTMEHVLVNPASIVNSSEIESQSLVKQRYIGDGHGRWCHNKCL